MGGYNSGGHNQKLVTVEASVRLDAAMLRAVVFCNPIFAQPVAVQSAQSVLLPL